MKMKYVIIGIILVSGLLFYLTSCGNKSTTNDKSTSPNHDTVKPKVYQKKENTFEGLRNMAFAVTPEQLGLSLPNDKTIVYGVIMDWERGGSTRTTILYQTGDSSLYLSTEGVIIRGGQCQNVKSAAKQFVSLAQTFLDKATKTETTPLPAFNEVWFYLLTNKGIFLGQEKMVNFENYSSDWFKLFEEGDKLGYEMRKIREK